MLMIPLCSQTLWEGIKGVGEVAKGGNLGRFSGKVRFAFVNSELTFV